MSLSTRVPDPKSFVTGGMSDVGQVRAINQDYCDEFIDEASGRRLLVLADGMGGHRGGEVASRLAVEAAGEVFSAGGGEPGALLRRALEQANARVFQNACNDPELAGMGTTIVCLLFEPRARAWVAHVGDSRAYRLRGGKFEQLTEDHSVVGALIRGGHITEEEARLHPQRNEILRAVGTNPDVEVQLSDFDVEPGDRYVLCSDGLSGMISDDEIAQVVASEEPASAVRMLVELANLEGGTDNITVQVVAVPAEAVASTAPAPSGATASGDATAPGEPASPDAPRERPSMPGWLWIFAGLALAALGWLILRG